MASANTLKARSRLDAAVIAQDATELQQAVAECMDAGLQGPELDDAVALLDTLQRKAAALARLRNANRAQELVELEQAIEEAKSAGLETFELQEAMLVSSALRASRQAIESREVRALMAAVSGCERAGIREELLMGTRAVLAEEQHKAAARSRLKAAVSSQEMEDAICFGRGARLSEQELEDAIKLLQVLRQLEDAMSSGSPEDLVAAINAAKAMGSKPELCTRAEKLLGSKQRQTAALARVHSASASREKEELEIAIRAGMAAGLDHHQLEEAVRIFETTSKLEHAMDTRDLEDLVPALQGAREVGVKQNLISRAQNVLEDERLKEQARTKIDRAISSSTRVADLRNAIGEAQMAGLHENEFQPAVCRLASRRLVTSVIHKVCSRPQVPRQSQSRTAQTERTSSRESQKARTNWAKVNACTSFARCTERMSPSDSTPPTAPVTPTPRSMARMRVQVALAKQDLQGLPALQEAIRGGKAAGIPRSELVYPERIVEALLGLQQTMKIEAPGTRDRYVPEMLTTEELEQLAAAIRKGRMVPLSSEVLKTGEDFFALETRKSLACESLRQAVANPQMLSVEDARRECRAAGLSEFTISEEVNRQRKEPMPTAGLPTDAATSEPVALRAGDKILIQVMDVCRHCC